MHTRTRMVAPVEALPGREIPMKLEPLHYVKQVSMLPPYPAGLEVAHFAMGCFWGVERLFWEQPGVYVTAVGYQARRMKKSVPVIPAMRKVFVWCLIRKSLVMPNY